MELPALVLLGVSCLVPIAVSVLALLLARRWLDARVLTLEDALRNHGTANAAMGRHILALEAELAALRSPSPVARQQSARPARPEHAPERPAARRSEPEFSEAELRLSRLIKSRLQGLRLN